MQAILDFFLSVWRELIPYWTIQPWEEGIRVRCGRWVKKVGPGMHWKWWVLDRFHAMNVMRQTVDLPDQTVETLDRVPVFISLSIQYEIRHIDKVYLMVQDFDGSLATEAMNEVAHWVNSHNYHNCTIPKIIAGNERAVRRIGFEWGCEVKQLSLNNLAKHRVYRLVTNQPFGGA